MSNIRQHTLSAEAQLVWYLQITFDILFRYLHVPTWYMYYYRVFYARVDAWDTCGPEVRMCWGYVSICIFSRGSILYVNIITSRPYICKAYRLESLRSEWTMPTKYTWHQQNSVQRPSIMVYLSTCLRPEKKLKSIWYAFSSWFHVPLMIPSTCIRLTWLMFLLVPGIFMHREQKTRIFSIVQYFDFLFCS